MKLVDSSGWLEYLTGGARAGDYEEHLLPLDRVLTPTLVIYEVYRWIRREWSREQALVAVAQLAKTRVVPLTTTIALTAADLGLEHRLAPADATIYATARHNDVPVVTSDRDLEALEGVIYVPKDP